MKGRALLFTAFAALVGNSAAGQCPQLICCNSGGGGMGQGPGDPIADDELVRGDSAGTLQGSAATLTDAGALSLTGQLNLDNILLDGNSISTTNTNGSLTLAPNGTGRLLFGSFGGLTFNSDGDLTIANAAGTGFIRLRAVGFSLSNEAGNALRIQSGNGATNWARVGSSGIVITSGEQFLYASSASDVGAIPDLGVAREAAGVARISDGSTGRGWLQSAGQCYVASDQTNATTTLATTTCSIAGLVSGRKYGFQCSLFLSDSVAADGAKVSFGGGTATESAFRAQVRAFDTTGLTLPPQLDDLTDVASVTTFTGDGLFEISGSFEPSGSGTFVPQFAQVAHSTGILTLYRGSRCTMWDMP